MRRTSFLIMLLLAMLGVYGLDHIASPRPPLPAREGPNLVDVKSWGYQLQGARPNMVPVDTDMLVIDYARDGTQETAWKPADIAAFRSRADGRQRIVLAYMSIGEAEIYRYYWRRWWRQVTPAWIGQENKQWRGNYRVQYWQPGWQSLFIAPQRSRLDQFIEFYLPWRKSYLDRILDAGFDGVYLDRVDAFGEWESRPTAEAEMAAFVGAISATAKARKPGAIVVVQNGEELLSRAPYRRAIDGIAKEDLMFGLKGDQIDNSLDDILSSTALLNRARADRLPVFVVEYVTAPEKRARAQRRMGDLGYVLHFARRRLNAAPEATLESTQETRP
jgi:cysteinyl-tRNA synthetase, unknown class